MKFKLTFSILFATFFTVSGFSQIAPNRDSAYLKVDCSANTAEDTIGVKNLGTGSDTLRWHAVGKRMPAGWDWMICDPNKCAAPGTAKDWFIMALNEKNTMKLDFSFPSGSKDSALVYIYVYKSGDSASTVKTLKYFAKVNCPASSLQSLSALKYSFVSNILTFPAGSNTSEVAIYNTTGKLIANYDLNDGMVNRINLNPFNKGLYIARVKSDKSYQTIKLMVE